MTVHYLCSFLTHTSCLTMSHGLSMQSPNTTRPYYQHKSHPYTSSQVNPPFQPTVDKFPQERNKRLSEWHPSDHQMVQPDSQVDWIMETLQQETSKHNETRMLLQSTRQKNFQLEKLLNQERSFNQSLCINVQEAEIGRITAESKAKAYEQQIVRYSLPIC